MHILNNLFEKIYVITICLPNERINYIRDYFKKIMKYISGDWDILNLGYHKHTCFEHNPLIRPLHQKIGTHIVGYKHNVITEFLKCIKINTFPIDWFLNQYIYRKFSSYTTDKQIFTAASYRTYEQDKDDDYKKFESGID